VSVLSFFGLEMVLPCIICASVLDCIVLLALQNDDLGEMLTVVALRFCA
jgi:hypothetical protein